MEVIQLNKLVAPSKIWESFNTLRTNLVYSDGIQVIGMTSTHPDEGKTVSSLHLANSFAALGKKTLLIDCDLRRSSLNTLLRIPRKQKGLSEVLTGQEERGIAETDICNLYIMSSGKQPPNPSELISNAKFDELIQKLREEFDYIIIDTPPAGVVMDAAIIGRIADAIVLVVANDQTKKKDVKRVKATIERNGGRIVGVLLNRVKKSQVDYSRYGYGNYY